VSWLTRVSKPSPHPEVSSYDDSASIAPSDTEIIEGKARWIHCTPLTGLDGKVGVIMVTMVEKNETANSLKNLSSMSSTRSASEAAAGPILPQARARDHRSFRPVDHTPERWRSRSSPGSVATTVTLPLCGGTINNPPLRSLGGSKRYAEYVKEIREAQRKVEVSNTLTHDNKD
jgi:hypothetical protein